MKEYRPSLVIAIVVHVVFLGLLFFNWQVEKQRKIVLEKGEIIQATAVDANSFDAEIRKIEQQKQAEFRRQQELKRQQEKQRKLAAEKKRKNEAEKKRKAEEAKKRKAEEKKRKLAAEKKRKEAEAQRLAEKKAAEKRRREEEQRKKEAQRAEQQRKEEQLRKEEQRKAEQQRKEEQRRKAEAEKKRQAEAQRRREAEARRQAELKRQQERERAEQEKRSQGIINRHAALISQKIERNWRQPLNVPDGLTCRIEIRLLPGGAVGSVSVIESSGNPTFDKSVETAVLKASPLPVPTEAYLFEQFKIMRLRFEPGSF